MPHSIASFLPENTSNLRAMFLSLPPLLLLVASFIAAPVVCQKACSHYETCATPPPRNCRCDPQCHVYKDCCSDAPVWTKDAPVPSAPGEGFAHCQNERYVAVDKCPLGVDDSSLVEKCEPPYSSNVYAIRNIPVSDDLTGVTYRNAFCARCHSIISFHFWDVKLYCNGSVADENSCSAFLQVPLQDYRPCLPVEVISTCKSIEELGPDYASPLPGLTLGCLEGNASFKYTLKGGSSNVYGDEVYKNLNCAYCNGEANQLVCQPNVNLAWGTVSVVSTPRVYSFERLMNPQRIVQCESVANAVCKSSACSNDEYYNLVNGECTALGCPIGFFLSENVCLSAEENRTVRADCKWKQYASVTEVQGGYLVSDQDGIFEEDKIVFHNSSSDIDVSFVEVCIPVALSVSNTFKAWITITGSCISICCIVVQMCIYILFPKLRNVPGQIQLFLIGNLLCALVIFSVSMSFDQIRSLCYAASVLTHFFFLCSFIWTNALSFDITRMLVSAHLSRKSRKRLYYYASLCNGVPLVIVIAAVIIDNTTLSSFRPAYGEVTCFFNSVNGYWLFFFAPFFVSLLFNLVCFVASVVSLVKVTMDTKAVNPSSKEKFYICVKLVAIMGLAWLFGAIAVASNNEVIWYIFQILFSLQGLFIFLAFIINKRVISTLTRENILRKDTGSGSRFTTSRSTISSASFSPTSSGGRKMDRLTSVSSYK